MSNENSTILVIIRFYIQPTTHPSHYNKNHTTQQKSDFQILSFLIKYFVAPSESKIKIEKHTGCVWQNFINKRPPLRIGVLIDVQDVREYFFLWYKILFAKRSVVRWMISLKLGHLAHLLPQSYKCLNDHITTLFKKIKLRISLIFFLYFLYYGGQGWGKIYFSTNVTYVILWYGFNGFELCGRDFLKYNFLTQTCYLLSNFRFT